MPTRRSIPRRRQDQVRRRARELCEYCHTAEQWQYVPCTLDHITPLAKGGANRLNNLALAWPYTNIGVTSRKVATRSPTSLSFAAIAAARRLPTAAVTIAARRCAAWG